MPPIAALAPNRFHHALSSNPMSNVGANLDNVDTAQYNVSANQTAQTLSAFGIPFSGLITHLVQNTYVAGLMRTFFPYWIDRLNDVKTDMKGTHKLADRAQ